MGRTDKQGGLVGVTQRRQEQGLETGESEEEIFSFLDSDSDEEGRGEEEGE